MLRCEGVTIGRGTFRLSADWTLETGRSLALIGPSGAGKSIFLSAIAGFETLLAGRMFWEGADLSALAPADRPLSMMFQDHNLFPHLTAEENVLLGLAPNRRASEADRVAVAAALEQTGLAGLGARRPKELSGGQQSRVALARAIVRARPLMLLDEPFAALGPGLRRELLALIRSLQTASGSTLIFVTHQPDDARAADLTSVVADGLVSEPKPTADVFDNPPMALRDYL